MKKYLILLIALFSTLTFADDLCQQIKAKSRPGDLLFYESNKSILQIVSEFQGGWMNHVGVVVDIDGELNVAESLIPLSRIVPFCRYFKKIKSGRRYGLKRWRTLSKNESWRLTRAAKQKRWLPYTLTFNFDSNFQYCSKFVYELFNEEFGIELGEINTFQEIIDLSPSPRPAYLTILWEALLSYEIPWDRRILTPKSQYFDPKLTLIDEGIRP